MRVMIVNRWSHILVEVGRVLRFGVVGIAATLVYIAAAMFADEWLGFTAVAGAIVGQAASTAVSYFGHLHYSFRVKSDHRVFLWRFVLIALLALALNIGVSWALTDVFGISHRIAIAVLAVLIPITNYLCNRFWVFLPGSRQTTNEVESIGHSPRGTGSNA
jgi:putative flippase GtrA